VLREPGKRPLALRIEKLTETGISRQVAISPDGKYVAYSRELDNKTGIWLRQLATNTNVEIVPAAGRIIGITFANSGESLYFTRANPTTTLYRVSLLGGVPTKVVDRLEGNISISHDDTQIAFIRKIINRDGLRECSLIVVDSNGGNERTLLVGTYPDNLDVPVWAPDGQSIICSYGFSDGGGQDTSLVEVNVDGAVKRDLSSERFFHIAKIAWLPDKTAMVMSGRKSAGDDNQLWYVSYPGMEVRPLTEGPANYLDLSLAVYTDKAVASQTTRIQDIWVSPDRNPQNLRKITPATRHFCWTPDGRLIYSSKASGNLDLWEMRPDGTGQRQLTSDAAVDYLPAVTPDNRYFVFVSNRTGAFQVWRMNRDGGNQVQLTAGSSYTNPAVSPDGKWVLFNSAADWHLWKVPIDGGEAIRLTDYVAYTPDVSPDGRLVASVGRSGAKRELLILSSDGGPPLKRFEFAEWAPGLEWTPDGKGLIYSAERGTMMSLMTQPLDGRPPTEVAKLERYELFDFDYSFDNRSLAVTRGVWQHDVVLISGFAGP
jgi:Tol biopolymer transport system component